jgi:hypothetical protein
VPDFSEGEGPLMSSRRILYGAVLIAVLTTLIMAGLRLLRLDGLDVLAVPLSFVAGAAVGGAGVMRRSGARWPEPVYAALLSAVLLVPVLRVAFPGVGPFYGGRYPGAIRDQAKSLLTYFVIGGAGAFVLPLLDPAVRRAGPRPALWKVAAAAAALVALFLVVELGRTAQWGGLGYSLFGLGVLVAGSIAAVIFVGLGLLMTLVGAGDMGGWSGGLGLMVAVFTVVAWVLTGMRWFP